MPSGVLAVRKDNRLESLLGSDKLAPEEKLSSCKRKVGYKRIILSFVTVSEPSGLSGFVPWQAVQKKQVR